MRCEITSARGGTPTSGVWWPGGANRCSIFGGLALPAGKTSPRTPIRTIEEALSKDDKTIPTRIGASLRKFYGLDAFSMVSLCELADHWCGPEAGSESSNGECQNPPARLNSRRFRLHSRR